MGLVLVPVQGDLYPAQPLQQQTTLVQARPSHRVPMTFAPGLGEASSSTISDFVALRHLDRLTVERERGRTQLAEENAGRGTAIITQRSEMAVEGERQRV